MKFKNHIILCFFILAVAYGELVAPLNGTNLRAVHVLFEWDQEPDASNYNLQVSNSAQFNNVILDINEPTTVYIEKDAIDWDSNYYWRVRSIDSSGNAGDWIGTSFFSVGQKNLVELDVDIYQEDLVQEGLVMYSQFSPYFAVGVIDKYGNEIWNTQTAYMNHINEYGQLYGVTDQGGIEFNYNHEVLWNTAPGIPIDSHEVKQIPNGNYMAFVPIQVNGPISPEGNWSYYFEAIGYQVDGVTNEFPWIGMQIVEFDKETGEPVWIWNPFDYFTMDDHDIYEGMWWDAYFNGFFDWMHSNAFHFDEEESVIYVSHRHLSRISKIAYPSGEVIWNMGLPAEYNTGSENICTDLLFSFQHNIQMMNNGDLLFFDNGNLSDMLMGDSSPTTRIRRIRVIDDSYCETVWQYDLPQNLHGVGMGSVQLLENGNYSIYTFGNGLDQSECSIIEITQDGDMVWKATSQNPSAAWYRSYKIPSIFPDAFSVMANNYIFEQDGNSVIYTSENDISFTVQNKSGYNQDYQYSFGDTTDGINSMFDYQDGDFSLDPYESLILSFPISDTNILSSNVTLLVSPVHHKYASKEIIYSVLAENILIGDVSSDGNINVVDVVLLVNLILENDFNNLGDIDGDGALNVIDIVQLVSLILS
tara:strand:- start:53 stop:1984 length:1932 start_codon:yes stop_codon:yes gene_type:complete